MLRNQQIVLRKSLHWRRILNTGKIYLSYYLSRIFRKAIVWGYPPAIMFEPTNICNLRCPLCPSGNQTLTRARGYMDPALFRKVVDEVYPYSTMLILWNQGEPFLHREFLDMVRYAADKQLFTMVSTNANTELDAEAIVKSGLDSIIVSLDGATQDTYNKYRINGDIEKVWKNVKNIMETRKRLGSTTPLVRWQFLVMKHNEHEIEEIKRLAKEMQVDQLIFKTAQIYEKKDIEEFLPVNPKYRRYKITSGEFELKFGIKNRCRRIWTQPVVNWDGNIGVCFYDKDIEHPVGSVVHSNLISIWKNDRFMQFRQRILKDRKSIYICRNCGEGVKLNIEEKKVR
ncbi:MAG TPA: radical SAM protein [Candidatus Cloacimonadota bacterium]|nr:radical SAM protein [Candidatus Cloacimonadota bacterium]